MVMTELLVTQDRKVPEGLKYPEEADAKPEPVELKIGYGAPRVWLGATPVPVAKPLEDSRKPEDADATPDKAEEECAKPVPVAPMAPDDVALE